MRRYRCYYACRYNPWSCKGSFDLEADSLPEAIQKAREHFWSNGGIEGINYEVREA